MRDSANDHAVLRVKGGFCGDRLGQNVTEGGQSWHLHFPVGKPAWQAYGPGRQGLQRGTDGMDGRDQPLTGVTDPAQGIAGLAARVVARLVDRDGPAPAVLREDLVLRFMEAVVAPGSGGVEGMLADIQRAGVTRIAFADRYTPEIARRLGKAWEDDTMGFSDVSIGTARLQAILREIGRGWAADQEPGPGRPGAAVLLIIPAEEQHTLGGMVLAGMLRRRGVSVALRIAPTLAELRNLFAATAFDGIMVSVGQASGVEPCRVLVAALKNLSPAPVAVGGAVLGIVQDVRERTGADVAVNDLAQVIRALGLERAGLGAQMQRVACDLE